MTHSFEFLQKKLIPFSLFFLMAFSASAQVSTKNSSPFPVKYTSLIDQKIILKTITLAPVYDNVNGIYAKPIQKLLVDLLQMDKVWGYSEFPNMDKPIFIEKFDSQPNDVIEVLAKTKSQGLLTAFITKGPRGLTAKLKLYTQDQGWVLLEESYQDINTFEISKLREKFVDMYVNIKNKLPYRGYVLSRRGLDVTLNLGALNGVKVGQVLPLAQILKINRHPKLRTMVGVEKEIIAKVKVTKVEPYLSFAQIIFEKETGVVDVGAKVLPSDYVAYPIPQIDTDGSVTGDGAAKTANPPADDEEEPQSQDTNKASAQNANANTAELSEKKALLDRQNSTGFFTAQGMIMQYKESSELSSGTNVTAKQSFAPGLYLGMQYSVNENIFVDVNGQYSSFSAGNSLNGSTPYTLSYNYLRYAGLIGYTYNYADEDEQILLSGALGYSSYKTDVSNSTPTALTSTQTNALLLEIKAALPLEPDYPATIGGRLDIALTSSLSESPVSSGDGKPSITSFGFFGLYPYSDKLRVRADIDITDITTSFGGSSTRTDPARSNSIETLDLRVGADYLF